MVATSAKRNEFSAVQMNVREIKHALQYNKEFFIQFFLGEELTFPIPAFHIDVFHLMTSTAVDKCVFAIPRDHAKTTLAKLTVVYYILFSHYSFIVYLSNVHSTGKDAVNDVIAFLLCDNFRSIYGDIAFKVQQDGNGFYRFDLQLTREDGSAYTKHVIIKALGAGQSVRGVNVKHRRPQLAIVDDLEDIENIATEELFMKLKKWFYGTFRKCLDKFDHKIIHIGNMLAEKCLLKEHCESEYWFSRRYGALLSNGEPLWPDAWPIAKLKADFTEYLKAGMLDTWFTEMMNLPIGTGRGLIKPDEIKYAPHISPEEIEYGFITIDPAISDKDWAHKSALAVHVWNGEFWQIAETESSIGMDPIQMFNHIVALVFKWNINVVGIESVAFQASLKHVFNYMAAVNGLEGLLFVDLEGRARKPQRIIGWSALLKAGEYRLTEGDFTITTQLLAFNPKKKNNEDDDIDACAYGPQMLENYLMEIMDQVSFVKKSEPISGYRVAEI